MEFTSSRESLCTIMPVSNEPCVPIRAGFTDALPSPTLGTEGQPPAAPVSSQVNTSEGADMAPSGSSLSASVNSPPTDGEAGDSWAHSHDANSGEGEWHETHQEEGSRRLATVDNNEAAHVRRRRRRNRKNRLATDSGAQSQKPANEVPCKKPSFFERNGYYYHQAYPLIYVHPFATPYETAYPISPSCGYATWLLTTYTQFCKRGFEEQSKYMAQLLKNSGWSGRCSWMPHEEQWHLVGIRDDSGHCFVPPPPLFLEFAGIKEESAEAMAYQESLSSSSTMSYHGSFAEFRKCGLIGMRSYMVEQLKMRGWSGHCFWREGADQWELIGFADNSGRCFVPPPPPPLSPKGYLKKEKETNDVVEVRQTGQSSAVGNCEARQIEPLVHDDNAEAAVLGAEKEQEENQAASPVVQPLASESDSHPVASGEKDASPSNVTRSHSSQSDHPAASMEIHGTATSAEPLEPEVFISATNDLVSDGQWFTSTEAWGARSLEEEHFGTLDDNEDDACFGMDGLEGFHLPRQMVTPDYYTSSPASQMGLALVRVAGEQIRHELGEIRRSLACQMSQKQELIEKFCGPKEHLLNAAKAELDLACMNGQLVAVQSGSERCATRPSEEEASSSPSPVGNIAMPAKNESMLPGALCTPGVRGIACRPKTSKDLQLQPGTLLWLLSCEGSQQCRRIMYTHSTTWNLTPQEVLYASHRFYELVADYHFAVATQEFLYGSWPLQPLKKLPGETALASPYVLQILSGAAKCPHGEVAKRDLETFQREHIELMQSHFRERRALLAKLLNPRPALLFPSSRPTFNPNTGHFSPAASGQRCGSQRRSNHS